MEKALRRRVGADAIDIDTIESYARYALARPARIDFAAIEEASTAAAYTLTELSLELSGVVVAEGDRRVLRVPATGQQFELDGDLPPAGNVRVRGDVSGWSGSSPRLSVTEWREVE